MLPPLDDLDTAEIEAQWAKFPAAAELEREAAAMIHAALEQLSGVDAVAAEEAELAGETDHAPDDLAEPADSEDDE